MTSQCADIRESLGAYVDGELDAVERQAVSHHLNGCAACADEQQTLRQLGDDLRAGVLALEEEVSLQGLAAGVISRTKAEDAQSWRALLGRAVEDWHWALVGVGSLMAATVSVILVAVICGLGPRPDGEDSLAAMLTNLQTPAGTLLIVAMPDGPDQVPILLRLDNAESGASSEPTTVPAGFSRPTGNDLVLAFSQAMVGPDGRMSELSSMSKTRRAQAEALLDDIQRRRSAPIVSWSTLSVQKLGLVTNTHVSGKAL